MNDVTQLLNIIGKFISKLSKQEVNDLIQERSQLVLASKKKTRKSTPKQQLTDQETKEILNRLNEAATREEGRQILEKDCKFKSDLEILARSADLPVQKRDTVSILRDRIIEATIGYRLRSRAIRGGKFLKVE